MSRFFSLVTLALVAVVVAWARFGPADPSTATATPIVDGATRTATSRATVALATMTTAATATPPATATATATASAVATSTPTPTARPTATPGTATTAQVGAPTGLVAEPLDTRVRLTWDPVTGATGYLVFRDGSATPLNALPVAEQTFDDLGLSNGRPYRYEIAAVDTFGAVGPRSTPATVTPRPAADW
jgi:hypothetical protein